MTVTLGLDGTGRVDIVAGGYEDWMRQKSNPPALAGGEERVARRGGPVAQRRQTLPSAASQLLPSRSGGRGKLSYKDQRDLDRLPAEIERLEREIAADEAALHDPDLYAREPERFAALTRAIADKRAEKDTAEMRWLEVAEMAEALSG